GGGSVRRRPQHGLEHRPVDPRAVRGDARPAVSLLAAPQPARDRAGEGRGRNRQPNRGRRSVGDGGDRARRDRRGGRPAFFGALDGGGTAPSRGCDPDGGGRGRGDGDGNLRFHGTDERVHGRDVHDVPGSDQAGRGAGAARTGRGGRRREDPSDRDDPRSGGRGLRAAKHGRHRRRPPQQGGVGPEYGAAREARRGGGARGRRGRGAG